MMNGKDPHKCSVFEFPGGIRQQGKRNCSTEARKSSVLSLNMTRRTQALSAKRSEFQKFYKDSIFIYNQNGSQKCLNNSSPGRRRTVSMCPKKEPDGSETFEKSKTTILFNSAPLPKEQGQWPRKKGQQFVKKERVLENIPFDSLMVIGGSMQREPKNKDNFHNLESDPHTEAVFINRHLGKKKGDSLRRVRQIERESSEKRKVRAIKAYEYKVGQSDTKDCFSNLFKVKEKRKQVIEQLKCKSCSDSTYLDSSPSLMGKNKSKWAITNNGLHFAKNDRSKVTEKTKTLDCERTRPPDCVQEGEQEPSASKLSEDKLSEGKLQDMRKSLGQFCSPQNIRYSANKQYDGIAAKKSKKYGKCATISDFYLDSSEFLGGWENEEDQQDHVLVQRY